MRTRSTYRWRAQAFGLDLEGSFFAPGLCRERAGAQLGRPLRLELAARDRLRRAWPARDARRLSRLSSPDGRRSLAIDFHPQAGFLLRSSEAGWFLLSRRAERLRCAPRRVPVWAWQRMLIGQALPLAATVRGLEPFHASAVDIDGCAVAFTGAPGAGKTSLAVNLVRHGAGFICDDAMVVEPVGGELLVHPGAALANVRHREDRVLASLPGGPLGRAVGGDGNSRGRSLERAPGPRPLRGWYWIDRVASGTRPAIEPAGDARALLGSTFNLAIRHPGRMVRHLQTCGRIAEVASTFRVAVPPSVSAAAVAASVHEHASGRW